MILAISAASAADIDDTSDSDVLSVEETTVDEVVSTDAVDEVQTASEDTEVLTDDGDASNFTALQYRINSSNTICYIMNDYKKAEGDNVVTISKDISIIARGGTFTIDANNNGGIFKINPGVSVYLSGVTLVNGNSDYGAAIYNEGDLVLDGCTFSNNVATQNGGAIYNTAILDIDDCTFIGNDLSTHHTSGEYGGYAIWSTEDATSVDISGSTFTDNGASYQNGDKVYGAVAVFTGATIENSVFTNNNGRWGGAIGSYGYAEGTLIVTGSKFNNNKAYQGGAIFSQKRALTVEDSQFNANEATDGGAIDNDAERAAGYDALIINSVFDSNKASHYGSAIMSLSGFTFTDCNFTNNIAGTGTATIHYCTNSRSGSDGMGDGNFADSSIIDCRFEGNSASYYGAVYFYGTKSLTVSGTDFINNDAGATTTSAAGALTFYGNSLEVTDSTFKGNTGKLNGSAISVWGGDASVSNSTFDGNTVNGNPNSIHLLNGKLALSNNTIVGDAPEIFVKNGEITSQINVVILNNDTCSTTTGKYMVTAEITDDNNNIIANAGGFKFVTKGADVEAIYNATTKLYEGLLTLPAPGVFTVNASYTGENLVVKTATIQNYKGTFQDLQKQINDAEAGSTLDLEYDFAYSPELDGASYVDGVTISKLLTINGNGYTINGSNAARIFKVTAATTIDNVTIADGYHATNYGGAAIYATAALTVTNTNFTNNGAEDLIDKSVYGAVRTSTSASFDNCIFTDNYGRWGGAIGAEGSGTITIKNSKFENNKARQGGAIDIEGYTLNIDNTEFIGNDAVMLGGAVHASQGTVTTVTNSKFERNTDYQGGAICSKGTTGSLTIDNSEFIANEVTGTEMPVKETWSSGGAIWVENALTLTNSNFTANKAEYNGGAVYIQPTGSASASIDNCRFVDNSAGVNYGAIVYLGSATLTVTDSYFDNNNVNGEPNAITLNGYGNLVLSGNTIEGVDSEIYVKSGTVTSQINITVMDNETHAFSYKAVDLYAAITDDNGNVITDSGFKFLVGTDEVAATFNPETKYYEARYTPTAEDEYLVSMNYAGTATLAIKTATISFTRSLIDIQNMIDAAEEGATITLDADYKYVEELDSSIKNGIVIDKAITIDGKGYTISGSNTARIFNITAAATLNNITLVNGSAAEFGGAIYTTADLTVTDSAFDNNNIVSQATTGEFGGSAIFADKGTALTIKGTDFTNNNKDYVNGEKSYGAVAAANNVLIEDSYFANNYARWGGAVTLVGYLDEENTATLTIRNTKFENNKAFMGGAVFSQVAHLDVEDSVFNSNEAYQDGGAIVADDYHNNLYTTLITDSSFDSNKAARYGSAIEQLTAFTYAGCNFTNNQAPSGTSTIHYMGSEEDAGFGNSLINDCRFEDNTAAYYGAIYFYGTKSLDIADSKFINNTGNKYVGAVFFNGDELTIDDSKFNDNTGGWAGAVFVNYGVASVSNSEFAGNTGQYANAILTATKLSLENNTINTAKADVYAYTANGVITSKINVVILDNETITMNGEKLITAKITDDNDNVIRGSNFKFDINGTKLNAVYVADGTYQATYANDVPGVYVVNITYPNEDNLVVKTATLRNIKGTFTDLSNTIAKALENGEDVNLTYNFAYVAEIDDELKQGVVISSPVIINGNGYTISGSNAARVFKVNAATTIDNVTIADGNVASEGGAAIYATAALTVTNSNFTNNKAPLVGTYGAVHTNTDASFDNCVFTNNTARWGGAIGAEGSGTITIKNSKFENNNANQGGAIDIEGYTLNVENTEFIGNDAKVNGGAIFISQGTIANIDKSKFIKNTGYQGGAINAKDTATLNVDNSEFTSNEVTGTEMPDAQTWASGGAIWVENKFTLKNSNFTDNYAEYNGAAVYYQKSAYVGASSIENCKFEDNHAGSYYGAVYYNGWDSLSVKDTDFINNTADKNRAGALYFAARNLEISGGNFINNTASEGGAVYYTNVFTNPAFNDNYRKLTITGANFEGNTATSNGGAVYVNNGIASITESTFDGNTANGEANAIYLNTGNLSLSSNTIVGSASEIVNNEGNIISKLNATILENKTWNDTGVGDIYILNATLTDDNGNKIYDPSFRFTVDGTELPVDPVFNKETGVYTTGYYLADAGLKVISTSYTADNLEVYNGALEIPKANITEFGVLTIDALEGENATIWITLIGVNDQGLNSTVTVIVNNKEYAVPVENGEGNLTVEGLTHGQYPVVAMFDDPSYNPAINSSVFFVKGKSVLNITELTVAEYGDVIEIAINLTDSQGKPLTGIVVVDETITVLVENGIGTFVIDNQPDVGKYSFQAVYDGDNDYFGDLAIFNVTVNTKVIDPEDIVVDIPNINEFGEAIPITITSPVDGIYTVNINGTPVEVEVVNGVGNATITLDKPGIYNATVDIADEDYSLETITTDDFEYLVTPEFNVEITGTYPKAEISITGPAGTYHVVIDGLETIDIVREESGLPTVYTIENIDAGNYTAAVSFDTHDEYYGGAIDVNFTVAKADSKVTINPITNVTYGNPVVIVYNIENETDFVTISITKVGSDTPEEFIDNEGTITANLPAGTYTISIHNGESDNYNESENLAEFTVAKAEALTITVEGDLGVMGGATVNVTVGDDATGYIIVDNNGVKDVYELVNGSYAFEIYDLEAGEYNITVTYLGDDNYNKTEDTKVLNIPKSATTLEITGYTPDISGGEQAVVNITMDNNLATGVVRIYVDGVESGFAILDEDYANATVVINDLANGTHTIGFKYVGNDNFNEFDMVNVTVTVEKADSKVTIDPITNVTVGNDVVIYYKIENNTNNIKIEFTNPNDEITVDYELFEDRIVVHNLAAGDYEVKVYNMENDFYNTDAAVALFTVNKIDVSDKISINPETITYGENATVIVSGFPEAATGNVTIKVGNKNYTAKVEGGQAIIEISGLAAGTYEDLAVEYSGDDVYNATYANCAIYVNKAKSEVSIPVIGDMPYPGEFTIEYNIENETEVAITVNGPNGEVIPHTVVDGKVVLTNLAAGEYYITIENKENENFTKSEADYRFNVYKANPTFTSEVTEDAKFGENVTITVKAPADGKGNVSVSVDGELVAMDVPVINGAAIINVTGLDAGHHSYEVTYYGDDNYETASDLNSFDIAKAETTVTIEVDGDIGVTGDATVNITVSNNATGYIVIDDNGDVSVVEITNGTYSFEIFDLTAGDYYINVTFLGNDNYLKSNATKEFNIPKSSATPEIKDATTEIKGGQDVSFNVTIDNPFATGDITVYVNGEVYDIVDLDDDVTTVTISGLTNGTYTIGVKYNGDEDFNESEIVNFTVTVTKADSKVTIQPIDNMTFAIPGTISYSIDNETDVNITIVDANNNEIFSYDVDDGLLTVYDLDVGTYTITIVNKENGMYKASNATAVFNVVENPDFSLNITNPENSTDTTFTIHVPEDAEGYLLVDVDGKKYYAPVENGTATVSVPGLAPGNYSANITYTGDDSYPAVSATADFTVPSNVPDNALTIPETSETTSPTYSISLPSDATGYLEVDVDGKKYVAPLVNGSASITVPGLSEGNHNVTVSYTGDGKYSSVSKDTTLNVHVPVYAITQNKNINVRYSATANYRVLITKDGKAVGAGETVSIRYNGKTYTVRTDSNGYATLKLNTKVKVKKYTITATYKGITVKNTVKVKNIIKAKNKKVKKSRKVTKVRISLLKVNGKVLKNKKIKVKFRYKWYKVKTNKKGVGYFKVKKSMLKKLKVGKKYKYRVTYGKDVVTKKLTIKR